MQYILTGNSTTAKIVFKYDLRGYLIAFEIEGVEEENQLAFLFWSTKFPFPYVESLIPEVEKLGMFKITQVADDLSFERFWKLYNYKVSKERVKKLWNKLSKANRIKVFLHLPKYEAHLKYKGTSKAYPDTYLRSEKYNDEY